MSASKDIKIPVQNLGVHSGNRPGISPGPRFEVTVSLKSICPGIRNEKLSQYRFDVNIQCVAP